MSCSVHSSAPAQEGGLCEGTQDSLPLSSSSTVSQISLPDCHSSPFCVPHASARTPAVLCADFIVNNSQHRVADSIFCLVSCVLAPCEGNTFFCHSNMCINNTLVCNGLQNCVYPWDENHCKGNNQSLEFAKFSTHGSGKKFTYIEKFKS